MKRFVCRKLRMLNYLLDRGFIPYATEPCITNPKYTVFLFEETPALTATITRYFTTDCHTAQTKSYQNKEKKTNDTTKEKPKRI